MAVRYVWKRIYLITNDMIIERWETFKKREKPQIYSMRDSHKYWAKETIEPTMMKLGWCKTSHADYGLEKPKKVALWMIENQLNHLKIDRIHFVYSFTKGKNGYMDYVQVFYKINDK